MPKTIAVIDGDLVAYRCAAAAEERSIEVVHKPSGRTAVFKNRTEFKAKVDLNKFYADDFLIEDKQNPQPIEYALHTAKRFVENIAESVDAHDVEIYIDGAWNFRNYLDLPQKYKGNRVNNIKPFHLQNVKQYLTYKFKAQAVSGFECDDMLVIRQRECLDNKEKNQVVACSTDKDNLGVDEGMVVYNWDKMDKPFRIPDIGRLWLSSGKVRGYGMHWFALQCLVGDPSDGFNPTHLSSARYGEKSAYKLLKNAKTEEELMRLVLDQYRKWYPDPVTYVSQTGATVTKDYLDLAEIYSQACYMLRYPEDHYDIRKWA